MFSAHLAQATVMKKAIEKGIAAILRAFDRLRRRSHAIESFAKIRDRHGNVLHSDIIAIPQTMALETYDVTITRYVSGGPVDVTQEVWSRAEVLDCVETDILQSPVV